MVKISLFIVSVASAFLVAPVVGQTPTDCVTPCNSIQKLQSCKSTDLNCLCDKQTLADADSCKKCANDAGVNSTSVPGFDEVFKRMSIFSGLSAWLTATGQNSAMLASVDISTLLGLGAGALLAGLAL
ncbi:hypothetical protein DFP72DRAFT_887082 [Ephemerocybe angulata]|uniref:Extracellular membrane protein CFEM domain-containing protein n=1 Tax=Ephemerocybe angulata TaxID=980116 RepID=A0A8H6I4U6_9AGAR|nr:hypothetical protein DFP72DRAFT_887082 [Tulosesus angulatus]